MKLSGLIFIFCFLSEICSNLSDDELDKKYSEFKIFPQIVDEVPTQLMIGEFIGQLFTLLGDYFFTWATRHFGLLPEISKKLVYKQFEILRFENVLFATYTKAYTNSLRSLLHFATA